eukprot:2972322-Amphidinium_carterae.1
MGHWCLFATLHLSLNLVSSLSLGLEMLPLLMLVEATCKFMTDYWAINGLDMQRKWNIRIFRLVCSSAPVLHVTPHTVPLMRHSDAIHTLWPLPKP